MAPAAYTEDTLVQQTTADYLRDALGWDVVYAYNEETFGPECPRVRSAAAATARWY